ncbi:hypothetical protein [Pseudonocardia lacus]|uniref:hypothetical protein n=1 Tax=Pseudonocardia lacus TaxID=2835865 RepID=UPI001BDD2AC8|nr:hypothetical protein [Pseudonocardia lacus]
MEPRPADPPPRLPAVRPDGPAPPPAGPPPAPGPGPRFSWKRFTRSPRGAAGLVIIAAALLLWPFSDWSVIPWLAGAGAVILLRLLRLDKLLRNWDLHLAGLVVVAGLMLSTGPWDWALAASIGVLLAGLAQLPWWRLAAIGAVMCLASGIGFAVTRIQEQQVQAQEAAIENQIGKTNQGARNVDAVLPTILSRIAADSPGAICDNLLSEGALAPFAASVGQPDCPAAVHELASRVTDRNGYSRAEAPTTRRSGGGEVDACAMTWSGGAAPPGPQLGRLSITEIAPGRFVVSAFRPC